MLLILYLGSKHFFIFDCILDKGNEESDWIKRASRNVCKLPNREASRIPIPFKVSSIVLLAVLVSSDTVGEPKQEDYLLYF